MFGFAFYVSPVVRSLPSNCHSPCFRPGPPLPPISPVSTARMPNRVFLSPFIRHADRPRCYRLLGRCLLSFCPQQSLAHYTCNQTVFSYIESIAACRRHSNNGLTSTNAINGMCLSLIILILDLIYMLSTDMPRFRKPARPVGLIHTITNHHKDFI